MRATRWYRDMKDRGSKREAKDAMISIDVYVGRGLKSGVDVVV